MKIEDKDRISAAVCEFYDVDMNQVRGAGRTPAVVVARCALSTELVAAGETVSVAAHYLGKTEAAVRAMLEQYETRATAGGFPLFVMPPPADPSAEETTATDPLPIGDEFRNHLVLDGLLRKAGGPRTAGDVMAPLYGMTADEALAIAIEAHAEHDIGIRDIADFFSVSVRMVADWFTRDVNGAATIPAPAEDVVRAVISGEVADGLEFIRKRNGEQKPVKAPRAPASDPAPPAANLLNYIDRADLYAIARYLAVNNHDLAREVREPVRRVLLSLVDALFDVLPLPEPADIQDRSEQQR